jgi:MoaA/NifB/PqqE/SkfB family radical SAM enzyme
MQCARPLLRVCAADPRAVACARRLLHPGGDLSAFEVIQRDRRPYVVRCADGQLVAALTRLEAVVLKMFESGVSPGSVLGDAAASIVPKVESRFAALLRSGIDVRVELDALEDLDPAAAAAMGLRSSPGPRVLHWCVTRFCPRRCVYCYAEPLLGGRAPDATLTREELNRIFAEAVTLGAEHLLVAGSEPFLRKDVPEIMGDALRHGVTPFVTTKHPMTPDIATRLATAGVAHISLSVDTMSPGTSLMLIGSDAYPGQVRRSAVFLREAGVEFSIQAVVTALNKDDIRDVAAFAAGAGARVIQVVPFEPVRRPITDHGNDEMTAPPIEEVQALVDEISGAHPELQCELFEKLGSGERAAYNCDIGMTKMFFLPDGIVHRCYKLIEDSELAGKDLRHTSVAAAWHDVDFGRKISPGRELYSASACGSCARFDNCHEEGRCIYQALFTHQDYHAPDRSCDGPYRAIS